MLNRFALFLGLFLFSLSSVQAQTDSEGAPPYVQFGPGIAKRKACGGIAYRAIEAGVEWLVANQTREGYWPKETGIGTTPSIEATVSALMALVGNGHSLKFGTHQAPVKLGVEWLTEQLEGMEDVRELAMATSLVAQLREFDGASVEPMLSPFASRLKAARTASGAWPARAGEDADALATSWAISATVRVGLLLGLKQSPLYEEVGAWIDSRVTKTGLVKGTPKGVYKEQWTAALLLARNAMGAHPTKSKYMERQFGRLMHGRAAPTWKQQDLEYWFATTAAVHHRRQLNSQKWWPNVRSVLLDNRNKSGGHWESIGDKGNVFSTAMALLILETPYRDEYAPSEAQASTLPSPKHKFGGRFGGKANIRKSGGTGTAEPLVDALAWLANSQNGDGSWLAADGTPSVANSSLALLALLGSDHSLEGPHRQSVGRGVDWLMTQLDAGTGRVGTGSYDHALATQALLDAQASEFNSPELETVSAKAIEHLLAIRNSKGTWDADGESDSLITGSAFFALKQSQGLGTEIDPKVWEATRKFFGERATTRTAGADRFHTAASLLCHFFLSSSIRKDPITIQRADALLKDLPRWESSSSLNHLEYWYFGSYGMHQMGARHWVTWNKAMKPAVLLAQRKDGSLKGSWDPVGPRAILGGRVYSTALFALTLEVYFRLRKQN